MLSNWCCRRLLRVPWTAKRSNQPILGEINPEYSLEGLMLKLQYSAHLMQRAKSLEKTLMLGKIEGKRRRGDRGREGWMASLMQTMWVWANSGREWRTGKPGVLQFMGSQRVRHDWTTVAINIMIGRRWIPVQHSLILYWATLLHVSTIYEARF